MNVALVLTVSLGKSKIPPIPIGLIYLGSALQDAGYKPHLFVVCSRQEGEDALNTIFALSNLLFVGFSVYMGEASLLSLEMANRVRARSDVPIIVGGRFPSAAPTVFLQEQSIDSVCVGYGEHAIVAYADHVQGARGLPQIVRSPFEGQRLSLDSLSFDWTLLNNWPRYLKRVGGKLTAWDCMETQRGCLYKCGFCSYSNPAAGLSSMVQMHSSEWVVDKIRELKRLAGVETVSFVDDEFWIDHSRAFRLLSGLQQVGVNVHKIRMRFSSVRSMSDLDRLSYLGVRTLNMGLESGCSRMLRLMRKGISKNRVRQTIAMLNKQPRLKSSAPLILGCPTETESEFWESLRFALSLTRLNRRFQFGVNFFKPLPGTRFHELAVKAGFQTPQTIEAWASVEAKTAHTLGGRWLPWFTPRKQKHYVRMKDYLAMYRAARTVRDDTGRGVVIRLGAALWEYFLYARLRLGVLMLPIDQTLWRRLGLL